MTLSVVLTNSPTVTDVTLVDARRDTAADAYVNPADYAIAAVAADDLEAGTPLAYPDEDFVAVDGVVAMEDEHASRVVDGTDACWERCDAAGANPGGSWLSHCRCSRVVSLTTRMRPGSRSTSTSPPAAR